MVEEESSLTRAIRFLATLGVPFEVATYDHKEKGAEYASQAIGTPLERTIKTLVVELGSQGYAVVLMPGTKKVSFKQLANKTGVKRAAMVDAATAQRLSGYLVGGISPFGMKQRLPVMMDKGLLEHDMVAVNGGKRGTMLLMAPSDILNATKAELIIL